MRELRDGRYVIVRVLGEGAQASTFEAIDKREGRLVAVKRFALRVAKKWKEVELAEREARVLASLSHPNLPAYVEHFEEDGALYLVMERIEGVSLTEFVKRGGVWGEAQVLRLLEQASVALAYLHSRTPPIIHRDLKPGNVLRKPDGGFAFVDFGAVRDRLRPEGGSTVVGTFGYMAPEQFQGRAVPASDVYSIGATALWMLTQTEPEDLPHKGLGIDVATALGSRASPALVTMLNSMLEPDPEKRAQSIAPLLKGYETRPRQTGDDPWKTPPPAAHPPPAQPPLRDRVVVIPEDAADKAQDVGANVARVFQRFLPIFWVFAGLSWWWLPMRTALSFTIGLVVLMAVARRYAPRKGHDPKMKFKRYARTPAIRVANVDDDLKIRVSSPPKKESKRTGDEEDAPARSQGRERRR